jgi:aspartate ammonia-lyase
MAEIIERDGKKFRMEHDMLGAAEVPFEAYYGIQTQRGHLYLCGFG